MSIWLSVAIFSYLLGAIIQWLQLCDQFQECEEYSNFPIVWVANVVSKLGCLIEALFWPYILLSDREC